MVRRKVVSKKVTMGSRGEDRRRRPIGERFREAVAGMGAGEVTRKEVRRPGGRLVKKVTKRRT